MSMTAETSNARGLDVEARQAWYEQQIALAETQWADEFYDMWECGDDVPSKEHYVALWLAERATPPPPAAARGDVRGLVALAERVQYADTHAQVSKDDAGEFVCLPPWLWLEIRDAAVEALAAEGVQAGEVDDEAADASVWTLIALMERVGGERDEGEDGTFLTMTLDQVYALESLLTARGHAPGWVDTAPPSAPDVVMEAWHSAVDNAAELRANAPDERYAKRAASVESWIKANRPAPPSASPDSAKVISDIEDALDRAEVAHKDRNGRRLSLVERVYWLIAAPPSAPVGLEVRGVADTLIAAANNPVSSGGERGLRDLMKAQASRLHALAQQTAAVALTRKYPDDGNGDDDAYNRGWNECLDALAAQHQEPKS